MPRLKFSDHASKSHEGEEWNARTIVWAILKGSAVALYMIEGTTADTLLFKIGTAIVGLIISKGIERIIITGYRNDNEEYWQEQGK